MDDPHIYHASIILIGYQIATKTVKNHMIITICLYKTVLIVYIPFQAL